MIVWARASVNRVCLDARIHGSAFGSDESATAPGDARYAHALSTAGEQLRHQLSNIDAVVAGVGTAGKLHGLDRKKARGGRTLLGTQGWGTS